jgi:hypothetical protein
MASIFPVNFTTPAPSVPQFVSGLRSKQGHPVKLKGDSQHNAMSPKLAKRVNVQEVASRSEASESASKTNTALILPISSLRMKHMCLDDTAKTPTLTPHTLTETALRKSEDLLSQLAALGLSLDEEVGEEAGSSSISTDGQLPLHNEYDEESEAHESPVRRSMGSGPTDTVEVPVALLNMFVETWTKYQNLHAEALNAKLQNDGNVRATSSSKASTVLSTTLADDASDEDSLPSMISTSALPSPAGSSLSPLPSRPTSPSSEPLTLASNVQVAELMEANTEKLRILHDKFQAFIQTSQRAEKAQPSVVTRSPVSEVLAAQRYGFICRQKSKKLC